ncbi:hypothetical protein [Agaribacterium haliotis]|uniref:hypothetical protein n=1 Tax=Agaribacterium haliotis TaxID=2013869 RepID=UPI000BB586D2|nr:hypothetical protein [Agaribacterium haliotis]
MKSKTRILWMQLHSYVACFFFPLALLYLLTGLVYMLGYEGEETELLHEPFVLDSKDWPSSEAELKKLLEPLIAERGLGPFPPDFYNEEGKWLSWYGYKRAITLLPTENAGEYELEVIKHSFWKQLLLIHKSYAGPLFWVFSFSFGLSLLFSHVSGLVIALSSNKFRRSSLISLGAGALLFALLFIFAS